MDICAVCRDARHQSLSRTGQRALPALDLARYDPKARYALPGTSEAAQREHAGAIVADLIRHHLPECKNDFLWRENHFIEVPRSGPLLKASGSHLNAFGADSRRDRERCSGSVAAPFMPRPAADIFSPDRPKGKSRCLARRQMRQALPQGTRSQRGRGGSVVRGHVRHRGDERAAPGSTSSTSAWPRRSAARTATSASGSSAGPRRAARPVAASCARPTSAAARPRPASPRRRSARRR